MIGCLWTRVRKQPIIALYFESENEFQFYNLEAWIRACNALITVLGIWSVLFIELHHAAMENWSMYHVRGLIQIYWFHIDFKKLKILLGMTLTK